MSRARLVVCIAYVMAFAVALVVGYRVPLEHPIGVALLADVAATLVIFGFSLALRNSSLYDPYWSVAPLPIAVYWAMRPELVGVNPIRLVMVIALLALWGVRLTWNWLRGWRGLGHEDWRYRDLQQRTGRAYWLVSFSGIHLLPTLWVFLGLLPVYASLAAGREPFGYLDLLAFGVTLGAIWIEARADKQLSRYRASQPPPEEFLRSGLWAWSRHPNYLGEMGFWWGLWLFALSANPGWWWTIVGPVSITLMFRFVSLPMIETRMKQRRPAYAEYAERSSLVVPCLKQHYGHLFEAEE
jgi:steroid 5-alpha reductase family enzyme